LVSKFSKLFDGVLKFSKLFLKRVYKQVSEDSSVMSKGLPAWKRRLLYFIPIIVGAMALFLRVEVYTEKDSVMATIMNWGIGALAGGVFFLGMDLLAGKKLHYRGKR
jgi:hypothetical protein